MPQFNEGRLLSIWAWNIKNSEILTSKSASSIFLLSLAKMVDMTPIAGPYPIKFQPPPDRIQDAGISVTVIIEEGVKLVLPCKESHLAIHTFPEQANGAAWIIIASCCDFNPNLARKWIFKTLITSQRYSHWRDMGGPEFFAFPNAGG